MNNELDLGRLIQSLDSRDRQVHKKAIEDLANSDPIPKELFIKLLVDKSDNIRSGIEDVLIKIGKPVVSSLILSLKSESRDLRMRSAKVLGKMLDPDAIEPLSIALKDEYWPVVLEAEKALKLINKSQKRLMENLSYNSDQSEQKSIDLVVQTEKISNDFLINSLTNNGENFGMEQIPDSINVDEQSQKRARILDIVKTGDPDVFNELVEALKYEDDYVRYLAAMGLGKIGDQSAVDMLISSLKDESPAVRKQSALALGKIGSDRALQHLINASKDEANAVRKAAKRAISKIKLKAKLEIKDKKIDENNIKDTDTSEDNDIIVNSINSRHQVELHTGHINEKYDLERKEIESSNSEHEVQSKSRNNNIDSLINDLNNSDLKIRKKAIQLLQNMLHEGDIFVLDPLIKSLSDENEFIRLKAAVCLGIIKDRKAIEPLELALEKNPGHVRKKAQEAIKIIKRDNYKKINKPNHMDLMSESNEEKSSDQTIRDIISPNITENYNTLSERTIEKDNCIFNELNISSEKDIDSPGQKYIEQIKSKNNDLDSLIKSLADLNVENKIKAMRLLRTKIREGDLFALDSLIKSLSDDDAYIRWMAATFLGIIKNSKAIEPLELALKDSSSRVRNKAQDSLNEIKNAYNNKTIDELEQIKELDISKEGTISDKINKNMIASNKTVTTNVPDDVLRQLKNKNLYPQRQETDLKSPTRSPNYWILQVNTKIYNLLGAITEIKEITHAIDPNNSNILLGDIAYLWDSQLNGIVATATVVSNPINLLPDNEELRFIQDAKHPKEFRIRLKIKDVLNPPIIPATYITNSKLRNISKSMRAQVPALIISRHDAKTIESFIRDKSIENDKQLPSESLDVTDNDKISIKESLKENSPISINPTSITDSVGCEGKLKAKVISTINLKGGVGKTTLTLALAEFLSLAHNKKVLLIDLDPQTNATVSLIDEHTWLEKNEKGETLYQLFRDKLDKTSKFDINKSIMRKVSNINGGIDNLSLLPSSIDLIRIQDSLPLALAGYFYIKSPVTILKDAINSIIDNYDFVLIDCPPNLGIITLNGIYMSDYYLIPTIPDHLSTWGIPQITDRINEFKEEANIPIKPLGIVISMYRPQCYLHDSTIKRLKQESISGKGPRVFDTIVPLRTKIAEAAEYGSEVNTLRQKYGVGDNYQIFDNLAKEVLKYAK